jgi:hypothetical protein
MRFIVMLLIISFATTCFAQDPLESLNTVEETVAMMEFALNGEVAEPQFSRAIRGKEIQTATEEILDDGPYFVSDEPLGARDWVVVRPCLEDVAAVSRPGETDACIPSAEDADSRGSHFWKSHPAVAADLRPGVLVVALDKPEDGRWVLAKVTDVSEVANGYVGISAPFKAQLKNLRIVDE